MAVNFKFLSCWRFSMMSISIIFVIICVLVLQAEARPSWTLPNRPFDRAFHETMTKCAHDSEILELCQRCAKATKSNFAYPMCCTNEENAVQWCHDYVYFGIQ